MPKRRELEPWEQNLVSAIKEQHRFGYSVRPMRGKVQVQRFWSDTGKRETVTLPVAWEKGCQRDVLNGINAINDGLHGFMPRQRHKVRQRHSSVVGTS